MTNGWEAILTNKTQRQIFAEAFRTAAKAVLDEPDQSVLPWLYSFSRELSHTVISHLKLDPIATASVCAAFPRDVEALKKALYGTLNKQKPN